VAGAIAVATGGTSLVANALVGDVVAGASNDTRLRLQFHRQRDKMQMVCCREANFPSTL